MSWVVISPDYLLRIIEILWHRLCHIPRKAIHSWFWRHTRFWRWNNFLFVHSIFLKRHWILESINIMLSFSSALGYCAYISHYFLFLAVVDLLLQYIFTLHFRFTSRWDSSALKLLILTVFAVMNLTLSVQVWISTVFYIAEIKVIKTNFLRFRL